MPGLLGLLGASGAGLAFVPALRALNLPFLALTVLLLGRGWYLQWRPHRRSLWKQRAGVLLAFSTALAVVLWGLRFAGLLGGSPF